MSAVGSPAVVKAANIENSSPADETRQGASVSTTSEAAAADSPWSKAVGGTALLIAVTTGLLFLAGALAEAERRAFLGVNELLSWTASKEMVLVSGCNILMPVLAIAALIFFFCAVQWERIVTDEYVNAKIRPWIGSEIRPWIGSKIRLLAADGSLIAFLVPAAGLYFARAIASHITAVGDAGYAAVPSFPTVLQSLVDDELAGAFAAVFVAWLVGCTYPILFLLLGKRFTGLLFVCLSAAMVLANLMQIGRAAGLAKAMRQSYAVVSLCEGTASTYGGLLVGSDGKNFVLLSGGARKLIPRESVRLLSAQTSVTLPTFLVHEREYLNKQNTAEGCPSSALSAGSRDERQGSR